MTVGRVEHIPRGNEVKIIPSINVNHQSEYSASFLHYDWQQPQLMNKGGNDRKMVPNSVENQSQRLSLFRQTALADIGSSGETLPQLRSHTGPHLVCTPGREGVRKSTVCCLRSSPSHFLTIPFPNQYNVPAWAGKGPS